jgi:hypothetical protein
MSRSDPLNFLGIGGLHLWLVRKILKKGLDGGFESRNLIPDRLIDVIQ